MFFTSFYLYLWLFDKLEGRIHAFLKYLQIIINQFNSIYYMISFMYENEA